MKYGETKSSITDSSEHTSLGGINAKKVHLFGRDALNAMNDVLVNADGHLHVDIESGTVNVNVGLVSLGSTANPIGGVSQIGNWIVNASIPGSIPVTGTFWQETQPVSGTFYQVNQPVTASIPNPVAVTGTFYQATQPISGSVNATIAGSISNTSFIRSNVLVPANYDYIALTYTGSNLTGVVYKTGGSGGSTVATLTLAYTGSQLDSVTKT